MLNNIQRKYGKMFGFDKAQKLIIIGSGPAGCTAALYAARAGLKPLVLHGPLPGGQPTTSGLDFNYPGWNGSGADLMSTLERQAKSFHAEFGYEQVTKLEKSNHKLILHTNLGLYYPKSLIIACGAKPRYLGIPSEKKYIGRGISACATCDGHFFKGKNVAVVGGGSSAVTEALYLSTIAKNVTLIHRGPKLRADHALQSRLHKSPVKVKYNTTISEILGGKKMNGLKLRTNGSDSGLECDGLFVAIGHIPATNAFKGIIKMDKEGYIIAPNCKTNINGVYAAGDCVKGSKKQAITAAASGYKAEVLAEQFLSLL